MPLVRCPQCGALNDTRAPDYPFCVGCQDNLAKCGYCRWFDGRAGACTRLGSSSVFEVGEDVAPPCGHHAPRAILLAKREGRWHLVIALGLVAAVFALAYGVIRLLQPGPEPTGVSGELQLMVEADYRGAVAGRPYLVMAQIYNASDRIIKGVRLEVGKDFLKELDLRRLTPEPDRVHESAQWRVFSYPEMHPRERRTIALELVPKRPGTFHLLARLTTDRGSYYGRADLPIRVRSGRPEQTGSSDR